MQVVTLSPGLTDTEIWAGMPVDAKKRMLEGFGSRIPAGRAATPDDVGHAIR
jgi:NAD(P)-dependent dehydrogenase (short-subunit alcohol dehydrogenase family)